MPEFRWLTAAEVREFHDYILEPGQLPGEDNTPPLESVLSRVEQQVHYGHIEMDVIQVAVTYAVVISRAHSFSDGNKRTALASMLVFLYQNGYDLDIDAVRLAKTIEDCAAGLINDDSLWSIIFEHITELSDEGP